MEYLMTNPTINTIKKEGRDTRAQVQKSGTEVRKGVADDLAAVETRVMRALDAASGSRIVTLLWGAVIFLLGMLTTHLLF